MAASTLTVESGFFVFQQLPDGPYVLRVLRIGFRAFDESPVTVANGTSQQLELECMVNQLHWRRAS